MDLCVSCACRDQGRISDALFYPPPPYSLMTEPPTEISAGLAACKPERSSCLCLPQFTGTGVAMPGFLRCCWDLSAGPNVCAASVEPGVCVSGFCGWHRAWDSPASFQLQEECDPLFLESILGRTPCNHCNFQNGLCCVSPPSLVGQDQSDFVNGILTKQLHLICEGFPEGSVRRTGGRESNLPKSRWGSGQSVLPALGCI